MSTTIEERVVEMRFDNKEFERNVQTSLSTLDKLKQGLNFKGASKSLENIENASKKVKMEGMVTAVETVGLKFNALYTIADQVLRNITTSVQRTGEKIVSALTIEPLKMGFSEYETQINAVQTILANTSHAGTNLDQVNRALDELNTYSDKTIYNFTEMTRNVGTFTAAGLDLQTSVEAIKGIANLAAISGSTSAQASTAMYQLSQALANGKVNLQDWNSVVNAGMGGKVFQDALVRTAAAMKQVTEETFRAQNITGSFRESISNKDGTGWLTAEVLSQTLRQFTGDLTDAELAAMGFTEAQIVSIQSMAVTANEAATKVKTFTQLTDTLKESLQSGWTQSFEIILGDFEEAKSLFTEISDMFGKMISESAQRRNDALFGGLASGWKQLLNEGISDAIGFEETVISVAKEHGCQLDKMIEIEGSFQNTLKSGWLNKNILQESVSKYCEEIRNLSQEEKEARGFTEANIIALDKFEKKIQNGTISLSEFTKVLKKPSGRENIIDSLRTGIEILGKVISPVTKAFKEIFPPTTAEQIYNITVAIKEFSESLKISDKTTEKLYQTFKGIFSAIDIFLDFLKSIGQGTIFLASNLTGLGSTILDNTAKFGTWISDFRQYVKETNLFGTAIQRVTAFLSYLRDGLVSFKENSKSRLNIETFTIMADGMMNALKTLWSYIKNVGSGIKETVQTILKSITEAFGSTSIFDVINSGLVSGILVGLLTFSNSLKKPIKTIVKGLELFIGKDGGLSNIVGIIDDVRGCFEAYQSKIQAGTLIKIAMAIGILAASIVAISNVDATALDTSLGAIGVLFMELLASLAVFTKFGSNIANVTKASVIMVSMSASVSILAKALNELSLLNVEGTIIGLSAIGGLMLELSSFLKMAQFDGNMSGSAIGIIALSAAMLILSKAVKKFGVMNWDEIGKGLSAIGGLMAELAIFTNLTGNASHVVSTGVSILIIGGALKILASALKDFGMISWNVITAGLFALGSALLEIALATKLMPKNILSLSVGLVVISGALKLLASALMDFGVMSWDVITAGLFAMGGALLELSIALHLMNGTLGGSAALIVAAGALALITPTLKLLGNMSIGDIGKALVTLAAAFGIIGIAGLLLTPIVPAILGLSSSLVLLGAASVGIGAGLALIAAGISALALTTTAGATSIVAALSVIITGILELLPTLVSKFGDIIAVICKVIIECAPLIVRAVVTVLMEVLNSLGTYIPQIVDLLLTFVITILNKLSEKMPVLLQSVFTFIGEFFKGITDALSGIDTSMLLKGIVGVGLLSALMIALSAVSSLIPGAMVGVLGMGGVIAELAVVLAALGAFAQIPGLHWFIEQGGEFLGLVGEAVGKFFGGLAGGVMEGISKTLPQLGSDLSAFMQNLQPFLDGTMKLDASTMDGVKALAETILIITAADVLNGITSWLTGGNSLIGFSEQLVPFGEHIKAYADSISGLDTGVVTNSVNAAKALSELAANLPNSGGLASLFTGDNDISSFGKSLVSFGKSFSEYYESIRGVNVGILESVKNQLVGLFDMASSMSAIDPGAITNFGMSLKTISEGGLVEFCNTFAMSSERITTAVNVMIGYLISAIKTKYSKFNIEGQNIITKTVAGIKSKETSIGKAFVNALRSAQTGIRNEYGGFYSAGSYLMDGLANGISANSHKAISQAKAVAQACAKAINDALDIKSPSRVSYMSGEFVILGLVNSLKDNLRMVYNTAWNVGATAKSGLNTAISKIADVISNNVDVNPVITPVLDLSNIESKTRQLDAVFSRNRAISISSTRSQSQTETSQNGGISSAFGNTYQFTQNNYSPKALSRVEIYRQTKNQFAAMKGALK